MLRLTDVTENEIKEFVHFLTIEPNHNYFYGTKKNSKSKKIFWLITSNPIWNFLTEESYVIVFDQDLIYLKKAFSDLGFGKFILAENITSIQLTDIELVSLNKDQKLIYLNFIANNSNYSFTFNNDSYTQKNYDYLEKHIRNFK